MGELVQFPVPEGAPQVSHDKGYLRWHHEAIQSPRGIEIAITDMRRALLRYGIEHKERYNAELGSDGFLGDHWLQMARGLPGDTQRRDRAPGLRHARRRAARLGAAFRVRGRAVSAALDAMPERLTFRGIRMYRVAPRRGETDRYETPLFGPDPVGIWAYCSPSGQWGAAFEDGMCAYGWSFEEAMEEARVKAIGLLLYQVSRLEALAWRS